MLFFNLKTSKQLPTPTPPPSRANKVKKKEKRGQEVKGQH